VIALLSALAVAAPRLDRVDLLSDDPGRWIAEDLPRTALVPDTTALRFAAQVTPVWSLGRGWQLGTSLSSQAIRQEWALEGNWWGTLAVSTHYGLPRGALFGVAVRTAGVRVGVSVAAMSDATWEHLDWRTGSVLPAVSVGWVHAERAPWMRGHP
jgi:hypothetical protein